MDIVVGDKFGLATVVGDCRTFNEGGKRVPRQWPCTCDCGSNYVFWVDVTALRKKAEKNGGCKSCVNQRKTTHGRSRSGDRTYQTWNSMLQRCNNPNHKKYHLYGGRGIEVCESWSIFENFLKDMGERPEGLTLDRKDGNKGYHKDNCRWATIVEQNKNRDMSKIGTKVVYEGEEVTFAQLSKITGINVNTLKTRYKRGLLERLTPGVSYLKEN